MNYLEVYCYITNICIFLIYLIIIGLYLHPSLLKEYSKISIVFKFIKTLYDKHMAIIKCTHEKYEYSIWLL